MSWRTRVGRPAAYELTAAFRLLRDHHVTPTSPLSSDDLLGFAEKSSSADTRLVISLRNLEAAFNQLDLAIRQPDIQPQPSSHPDVSVAIPGVVRRGVHSAFDLALPPLPSAPPPTAPSRPGSIVGILNSDNYIGTRLSEDPNHSYPPVRPLLIKPRIKPLSIVKRSTAMSAATPKEKEDPLPSPSTLREVTASHSSATSLVGTALQALRTLTSATMLLEPLPLSPEDVTALDEVARLASDLLIISPRTEDAN
jgi:hypothetical protein